MCSIMNGSSPARVFPNRLLFLPILLWFHSHHLHRSARWWSVFRMRRLKRIKRRWRWRCLLGRRVVLSLLHLLSLLSLQCLCPAGLERSVLQLWVLRLLWLRTHRVITRRRRLRQRSRLSKRFRRRPRSQQDKNLSHRLCPRSVRRGHHPFNPCRRRRLRRRFITRPRRLRSPCSRLRSSQQLLLRSHQHCLS